jgi:Protein of unknown function (DUF2917)
MNPDLSPDPALGHALTVDESPITLRLHAGSAVFAVRGEAWITQEGTPHDVILRAGERFNVPIRAPLVISATRGCVDVYVARPAAARMSASCSVHDLARAHAIHLRRLESVRLVDALAHGARSLLVRVRGALTARPRVPTH